MTYRPISGIYIQLVQKRKSKAKHGYDSKAIFCVQSEIRLLVFL